jgi:hypothetical protein
MDTEIKACKTIEASLPALLPDLLLDPAAVPVAIQKHVEACDPCRAAIERELAGHREAMRLLEDWSAPEVTPYFESRMAALLREEQQRPRAGVIERVRSWMLLTNLHMKPMAGVAALGLLLAIGGGAYVDLTQSQPAPVPQASATVRDLQSLDDNAQIFQQMNSLDAGDSDSGNSL